MERLLVKIKKEKKYAFLMGDYNVNTILETHNNMFHLIITTS